MYSVCATIQCKGPNIRILFFFLLQSWESGSTHDWKTLKIFSISWISSKLRPNISFWNECDTYKLFAEKSLIENRWIFRKKKHFVCKAISLFCLWCGLSHFSIAFQCIILIKNEILIKIHLSRDASSFFSLFFFFFSHTFTLPWCSSLPIFFFLSRRIEPNEREKYIVMQCK